MTSLPRRFAPSPKPAGSWDDRRPVVVVGAGLVGLTLALDLGQRGVPVTILERNDAISVGSRAIVFARRSLEILARLGLGDRIAAKGVAWDAGTVYHQDRMLFRKTMVTDAGCEHPPFLNLQQYYVEEWLIDACLRTGLVDLRWNHEVLGVAQIDRCAEIAVSTSEGSYRVEADWLLACDGASSCVRRALALPFVGHVFRDRFLIADVKLADAQAAERRFWFDAPFHPGRSVLLHKQPDDVWRVDFQLGWDADPDIERRPEHVMPRLRKMFGAGAAMDLVWASVYTFKSRRLERFVHDRIVFAGDSAHQVSPFGGRGGNGGIQDADNLAWKIAEVVKGRADHRLIASYDEERVPATDENILESTRSAEFITPSSPAVRAMRDAVLYLATTHEFARRMVNSGRLSSPRTLRGSSLNSRSSMEAETLALGSPAPDVSLASRAGSEWLLRRIGGGFTLLHVPEFREADRPALAPVPGIDVVTVAPGPPSGSGSRSCLWDGDGSFQRRYGLAPGECMLFRPDQHLAAHLPDTTATPILRAHARALAHPSEVPSCH